MKKISVNKSDEIAIIVEKIIEAPDEEIVLNIPRFSHLGESLSNFHLLKREADALGKKISIESVDDHIVELAEMSGLTALNPFFAKTKRQFSDIVAPKAVKITKRKPAAKVFQEEAEERLPVEEPVMPESDKSWKFRLPEIAPPEFTLPATEFRPRFFIWAFVIFTVAVFGFNLLKILPSATVVIVAQTQEWSYNDSIITDKAAVLDPVKMTIPNQVFSEKKNVQLKFPATGRRQVERKAGGTITVFNSYSSDPQPLVEQTRFITPDGKIYRLTKTITVPGAKIVEGKIVPSSIDTEVSADKPGPDYNIGPVKLFTIPGFKGTPKYQSFYGESTGNMTGGFIGEVAYPTDSDIKNAKEKAQAALEDSVKTVLLMQIPKEFKVLDGSTRYKVLEQKVDSETDEGGSFGIFSEAQMTIIAFKENDLKELLDKRAKRDNGEDLDMRENTLDYELARADFDRGLLTFPVNFKAILAKRINAEELKSKILGKSEIELKTTVFALPGLKSATVSLWPFYVKTVPTNPRKVTIKIE
ncbi:MAG: hypothetical protein HZB99_02690 [Candidatus Harrisonbacteria bacterium]|nr:hypothetical protein [Candidatus Harrisonbacteria bacterium]